LSAGRCARGRRHLVERQAVAREVDGARAQRIAVAEAQARQRPGCGLDVRRHGEIVACGGRVLDVAHLRSAMRVARSLEDGATGSARAQRPAIPTKRSVVHQDALREALLVGGARGARCLHVAFVARRHVEPHVADGHRASPRAHGSPRVVVALHVDAIAAHEVFREEGIGSRGVRPHVGLVEVAAKHRGANDVAPIRAQHREAARGERGQRGELVVAGLAPVHALGRVGAEVDEL
jgi:hypothetical protein